MGEMRKYLVLPLDDRGVERFNSDLAGRPVLVKGNRQMFYPGMKRISEASVLNTHNKSFQVTAQVVVPDGAVQGTIIAQGGGTGGWALLTHEGSARFAYSLFGLNVFVTDATKDNCAKAAVILKALGGGSLVKAELPHDWKDRVENAKIIVTGDRATLARNLLGKSSGSGSNFQKIGGQWRLVAKDNVTHG